MEQNSLDSLLSPEQFKEIEELAAVFFTPKEIAIIVGISVPLFDEAVKDETTNVYNAFQRGRLQSEYDLRKSIVKLAKSGSSPAQTMAMDLLQKSKLKMIN